MAGNIAQRVYELIKSTVEEQGVSLWDVKYIKEGASWYLRVFIDSDESVSIDNCTDVSHAIDPILDENDPIDSSYYLEVSSPGLGRELVKPWHFEKFMGSDVRIKLYKAVDGAKELTGVLVGYSDGTVTISINGENKSFVSGSYSVVKLDDKI